MSDDGAVCLAYILCCPFALCIAAVCESSSSSTSGTSGGCEGDCLDGVADFVGLGSVKNDPEDKSDTLGILFYLSLLIPFTWPISVLLLLIMCCADRSNHRELAFLQACGKNSYEAHLTPSYPSDEHIYTLSVDKANGLYYKIGKQHRNSTRYYCFSLISRLFIAGAVMFPAVILGIVAVALYDPLSSNWIVPTVFAGFFALPALCVVPYCLLHVSLAECTRCKMGTKYRQARRMIQQRVEGMGGTLVAVDENDEEIIDTIEL